MRIVFEIKYVFGKRERTFIFVSQKGGKEEAFSIMWLLEIIGDKVVWKCGILLFLIGRPKLSNQLVLFNLRVGF